MKRLIKDCFKINGNQTIKMPKKDEYVKFKTFERKIKSSFIIYKDFGSILAPEDNRKQNRSEPYTSKYVDDKFSKLFKSYLGEDAVYNFISSMIEKSK